MSLLLGCIADDFTGATDLANMLTRHGMKTIQTIGIPKGDIPDAEAIVVALKSRTIPAAEAVAQSLEACRWLKAAGARQIFFKYCSTFDSTDKGNIGPVADALLDELAAPFTIACPAFPENKRSIYLGHLFVGNELLSDSSMRNHPLTPMRDSNLVRVLGRQTKRKVGLVPANVVARGSEAIAQAFAQLQKDGVQHAIVDALQDEDLFSIGHAASAMALVTGGSGIAMGLPDNFRAQGLLAKRDQKVSLAKAGGLSAVLAGSCSVATLKQVETFKSRAPAYALDPLILIDNLDNSLAEVMAWARPLLAKGPVLIYSTATPDRVAEAQGRLGRDKAGELIELAMARLATMLTTEGVHRLVVAGGETSGAVVSALGVEALEIGPQIAPGVPATLATGSPRLGLVLKSGNFGGPEFFSEALDALS
ncbi:MAG: four-carbon acid sugar kinase family protein [Proteobacteria bacterium]|nr:four-carbon acid sugar kinase family protein [Pseudomonadota bacterium]